MRRQKILWCDTETTGLDPIKNDIWQMAYIIEIDGVVEYEHTFKVRPYNLENYTDSALRTANVSLKELQGLDYNIATAAFDLKETWGKYIDKYNRDDKFIMAGYNVRFDFNFIYEMFLKTGDKYGLGSWCYWPVRDVATYVADVGIAKGIKFQNFKLSSVCEAFGIEFDAHDALEDVRATKKLYEKLIDLREKFDSDRK